MMLQELGDTLVALITAVSPPPEYGLIVTYAELDVPLETFGGVENGQLVFYGNVPHSRWKSGFLPPVHPSRLVVTLLEYEPEDDHA
jgi:hypothetical protein